PPVHRDRPAAGTRPDTTPALRPAPVTHHARHCVRRHTPSSVLRARAGQKRRDRRRAQVSRVLAATPYGAGSLIRHGSRGSVTSLSISGACTALDRRTVTLRRDAQPVNSGERLALSDGGGVSMLMRTATAFLASGLMFGGVALAQTAPNPTRADQVPVYKIVVVR